MDVEPTELSVSKARDRFSDAVNRAVFAAEITYVTRGRGRSRAAAIVPVGLVEAYEMLIDREDGAIAAQRLADVDAGRSQVVSAEDVTRDPCCLTMLLCSDCSLLIERRGHFGPARCAAVAHVDGRTDRGRPDDEGVERDDLNTGDAVTVGCPEPRDDVRLIIPGRPGRRCADDPGGHPVTARAGGSPMSSRPATEARAVDA